MWNLDHLVITVPELEAGVAWVEGRLGVPLQPGGRHELMGTHNKLLSLGPDCYLEVIAIDPAAPALRMPRWYDLDAGVSASQLTHWACNCENLSEALRHAPADHGQPVSVVRGALRWQMAVTKTGRLPFDDVYPALLAWEDASPAPRLIDQGVRLSKLVVSHPEAVALREAASLLQDKRVRYVDGPPGLSAVFDTSEGTRHL